MRADVLFREHRRLVRGICGSLLRDDVEAEDAVQEVFLSAHRALVGGSDPQEPAAWLATIARNECRGRIRARMRMPLSLSGETEDRAPGPSAEALRRCDLAVLWQEIRSLPRPQQEALLLREFGGLSYTELATALGVSVPAVESLLFRARARLRGRLDTALAGLNAAGWLGGLRNLLTGVGAGSGAVAAKTVGTGVGVALLAGGAIALPRLVPDAGRRHPPAVHPTKAGATHALPTPQAAPTPTARSSEQANRLRPVLPFDTVVSTPRPVRHRQVTHRSEPPTASPRVPEVPATARPVSTPGPARAPAPAPTPVLTPTAVPAPTAVPTPAPPVVRLPAPSEPAGPEDPAPIPPRAEPAPAGSADNANETPPHGGNASETGGSTGEQSRAESSAPTRTTASDGSGENATAPTDATTTTTTTTFGGDSAASSAVSEPDLSQTTQTTTQPTGTSSSESSAGTNNGGTGTTSSGDTGTASSGDTSTTSSTDTGTTGAAGPSTDSNGS